MSDLRNPASCFWLHLDQKNVPVLVVRDGPMILPSSSQLLPTPSCIIPRLKVKKWVWLISMNVMKQAIAHYYWQVSIHVYYR